jgi:hypothetical protein
MWLTQAGANSTRPLKKRKKLADYGIGASTPLPPNSLF